MSAAAIDDIIPTVQRAVYLNVGDEVSAAVPGDQDCYLMVPRSEFSMNRISSSTSSPRSDSAFNFARAWLVFIFEASKILYAW